MSRRGSAVARRRRGTRRVRVCRRGIGVSRCGRIRPRLQFKRGTFATWQRRHLPRIRLTTSASRRSGRSFAFIARTPLRTFVGRRDHVTRQLLEVLGRVRRLGTRATPPARESSPARRVEPVILVPVKPVDGVFHGTRNPLAADRCQGEQATLLGVSQRRRDHGYRERPSRRPSCTPPMSCPHPCLAVSCETGPARILFTPRP